jgi:hypothetical protein
MTAVIALIVGLAGGAFGALVTGLFTRRNDRESRGDELLAQAANNAIDAIAEVVGGTSPGAKARYASAVAHVALHASPQVAETWRRFQDDPTTATDDGRARMVTAVQSVRTQLGHGYVSDADLHVLLFGSGSSSRS